MHHKNGNGSNSQIHPLWLGLGLGQRVAEHGRYLACYTPTPLTHPHYLSLTHTHSPTLTLTHSLTHSLTPTHPHSLSLTLTHPHSHPLTHTHSPTLTLTHSHSPTLTPIHLHSLSLTHSHSPSFRTRERADERRHSRRCVYSFLRVSTSSVLTQY